MKIAHIVSTFPPYKGGMGNACFYQTRELIKLGHEVTILTPQYRKELRIKNYESRIKVVRLRSLLKFGNAAFVPQIIRYLKNFDIVHLHWPFIGGAEIILFWFLFCRKQKLIIQYQMDLVGRGVLGQLFNFYQQLFIPLMVKAADKIIISSFDYAKNCRLKKYLQKYPGKFIEIPLGVDTDKFYPKEKKQDLTKRHNLKPGEQIILFVGGLDRAHYFKGLKILLQAISRIVTNLPRISLIIVGAGDLQSDYKKLAKTLGIDKKVIFAGRVSDEELVDYYNLADIFVLPSTTQSEAFGLVLLEAMACAKPIIVSSLPGPRTLVQENKNGLLVKPADVDDLSKKIKFLLENKNLAEEWGRVGRKIVEEKYTWPTTVQKLDKIY